MSRKNRDRRTGQAGMQALLSTYLTERVRQQENMEKQFEAMAGQLGEGDQSLGSVAHTFQHLAELVATTISQGLGFPPARPPEAPDLSTVADDPLAALQKAMETAEKWGTAFGIHDKAINLLQAYFAGRAKHLSERVMAWLADGNAVIPADARGVRDLLLNGGEDGDGWITRHGKVGENGRCCVWELLHLACSPHYESERVQALVNEGRTAEAVMEADLLDVSMMLYIGTDGLIPLVEGCNTKVAEDLRQKSRESLDASRAAYNAETRVAPSHATLIPADSDDEAIAKLIGGFVVDESGGSDPTQLPPTVS